MNIYLQKKQKAVNSFTVTLFLIFVSLGYFLYFYVPLWWPVFQLTGIMRGICNDAYRTTDDEKLMKSLMQQSTRVRLPGLTRENFELERVPYDAEELAQFGDKPGPAAKRGKKCLLSLYYERDATLPLIGKTVRITWDKQVEQELSIVKWDKQTYDCSDKSPIPKPDESNSE